MLAASARWAARPSGGGRTASTPTRRPRRRRRPRPGAAPAASRTRGAADAQRGVREQRIDVRIALEVEHRERGDRPRRTTQHDRSANRPRHSAREHDQQREAAQHRTTALVVLVHDAAMCPSRWPTVSGVRCRPSTGNTNAAWMKSPSAPVDRKYAAVTTSGTAAPSTTRRAARRDDQRHAEVDQQRLPDRRRARRTARPRTTAGAAQHIDSTASRIPGVLASGPRQRVDGEAVERREDHRARRARPTTDPQSSSPSRYTATTVRHAQTKNIDRGSRPGRRRRRRPTRAAPPGTRHPASSGRRCSRRTARRPRAAGRRRRTPPRRGPARRRSRNG